MKTVTWDAARAVRLAAEGKTYVQIGEMLGVSASAIGAYFRRNGNSVHKARHKEPGPHESLAASSAHSTELEDGPTQDSVAGDISAKPPVGVMPLWLWVGNRLDELAGAIGRYTEARMVVPAEWVEEYNGLLSEQAPRGSESL